MSTVSMWSGKNYLKHNVLTHDTMDKPNTSDGGVGFYSAKTVPHTLQRIPIVRASYDPDGNGTIYPMVGQFNGTSAGASSDSPLGARSPMVVPFMLFVDEVTTTTVTFRTYKTSSLAGTFTFYYRIYIDPSL